MAGSKMMKLRVGNVISQDSLNYFQQPLAALPKAFGFEAKVVEGTFCHDWNKPKYFDYIGPVPPSSDSPYMKLMKESEATKLKQWHKHLTDIKYYFLRSRRANKMMSSRCRGVKTPGARIPLALQRHRWIRSDHSMLYTSRHRMEVCRVNHLKDSKVGITPIAGYAQRMTCRHLVGHDRKDW